MSEKRTSEDESKVTKATEWLNEKLYPILGPPPLGPYETNEERRVNENGQYPQEPIREASDDEALHEHPDLQGHLPEDEPAEPGSPEADADLDGHYPANFNPDESQESAADAG